MVKDIGSLHEHDKYYKVATVDSVREQHATLTNNKVQYRLDNPVGEIVDNIPEGVKFAVDIGAGHGWGANYLAQTFDKVWAIEPSIAALDISKVLYKNVDNIVWINGFAEEELGKVELAEPALFYCACVLSHLQDETASAICSAINRVAQPGSQLSFSENWGTSRKARLWYTRTREWWETQLPGWELTFREAPGSPQGTKKGVTGIKKQ